MQKEKVDIDDEKSAQISVVAKHFVTQMWSEIMIMKYKQAIHYFLINHQVFRWKVTRNLVRRLDP